MATYELLGLNEATPRAVAPTASDTGVVSNLAVTTNLTSTAGTANGVTYLNGSKVLTSGSGLQFDGTNLGVGTTSPSAIGTAINSYAGDGSVSTLALEGHAGAKFLVAYSGSSADGPALYFKDSIRFATATSKAAGGFTEKARIDSDGLKFNGDTAAANALNDCEKGNWSPTMAGFTTSGVVTATGSYRIIGSLMYIRAQISVSGGTTESIAGTSYLTNLPVVAQEVGGAVTHNASTGVGLGTGSVQGNFMYPASWTATANVIVIDAVCIV